MNGLVCLTSISNIFSVSGIRFQETRVEAAGRQFWSTNKGASATQPPAAPGMPSDGFWDENDPLFPAAWPAKYTLPVVVRDPASFPKEWQLLAMDEVVVSFWKITDFAQRRLEAMTKRLAAPDVPQAEGDVLQKKVEVYTEQLEKARKLQRNVIICVECFKDQAESDDRAWKAVTVEQLQTNCQRVHWLPHVFGQPHVATCPGGSRAGPSGEIAAPHPQTPGAAELHKMAPTLGKFHRRGPEKRDESVRCSEM